MKKGNLKDYRNENVLREQVSQVKDLLDAVMQENEDLKERMECMCQELREEVEDELREEYEERMRCKENELERARMRLEWAEKEIGRLQEELEQRDHDEDTRLKAIREILGCTVNNVQVEAGGVNVQNAEKIEG